MVCGRVCGCGRACVRVCACVECACARSRVRACVLAGVFLFVACRHVRHVTGFANDSFIFDLVTIVRRVL